MSRQAYKQTAYGLGSNLELLLISEDRKIVDNMFDNLWKEIAEFEQRFSRFINTSELSYFNKNAGQRLVVSAEFREILSKCIYYGGVTKGVFNPFVLPSLQRSGYVGSINGELTSPDYRDRKIYATETIQMGKGWVQIPNDSAIDLGGIGKGYLADKLSKITDLKINDYCLSIGGDIIASGSGIDGPWQIGVQSAKSSLEDIASYSSKSSKKFAIATSGQARDKNGRPLRHIIDAKTGKISASKYLLSTVVACNATAADVLASCLLIRGPKYGRKIAKSQDLGGFILQSDEANIVEGNNFQDCIENDLDNYTSKELNYA